MKRWALVRDDLVREYLLHANTPTQEEFNLRAWGSADSIREDGAKVEDEGTWIEVIPATLLVTTGWRYTNGTFAAPK